MYALREIKNHPCPGGEVSAQITPREFNYTSVHFPRHPIRRKDGHVILKTGLSNHKNKIQMKNNNNFKGRRNGSNGENQENQLFELFENELKDIYWAEKALVKAIPKMVKRSSSQDLVTALENHLSETEEQVKRLEKVFSIINRDPRARKCEGMNGLIKEGDIIMRECEEGPMRDAGIIAAAQKIEHYEIASYGTLRTFAQTLGLNEASDLLQESLDEEKAADQKLTELAESEVNAEAV